MTTIAILGTGIMGAPMARNLSQGGFTVRAWNRTRSKAEPLAGFGVTVCDTPREAAEGADVLITMVLDVDAVLASVDGRDGALAAFSGLWLQMSTVGVAGTQQLAGTASHRGIPFIDAPVLGTRQPAEQGQLTVLASGPSECEDDVRRLCDPIAAKVLWLGGAGAGSKLKLVMNSWVLALTTATAEALALADGLGVDPKRFFEVIDGGPLDVAYARMKGGAMLKGEFPAAFPVAGAAKDAGLIVAAAEEAGVSARVADAVREAMAAARDAGHGSDDMAAVWHVVASETVPRTGRTGRT